MWAKSLTETSLDSFTKICQDMQATGDLLIFESAGLYTMNMSFSGE